MRSHGATRSSTSQSLRCGAKGAKGLATFEQLLNVKTVAGVDPAAIPERVPIRAPAAARRRWHGRRRRELPVVVVAVGWWWRRRPTPLAPDDAARADEDRRHDDLDHDRMVALDRQRRCQRLRRLARDIHDEHTADEHDVRRPDVWNDLPRHRRRVRRGGQPARLKSRRRMRRVRAPVGEAWRTLRRRPRRVGCARAARQRRRSRSRGRPARTRWASPATTWRAGAHGVATTTSGSVHLTGLRCGTTYSLAVSAFDLAGNTSNPAFATTARATDACDAAAAVVVGRCECLCVGWRVRIRVRVVRRRRVGVLIVRIAWPARVMLWRLLVARIRLRTYSRTRRRRLRMMLCFGLPRERRWC